MNRRIRWSLAALLGFAAGWIGLAGVQAEDPVKDKSAKPDAAKAEKPATAATPVKPKAISENVKKGLAYLVNQQREDGGWGQGGGWRSKTDGNRVEGKEVEDPSDVANTCMAMLALIRAGNTCKEGEYSKNVAKGFEFICKHIEKADKESMYITEIRGTQVQSKIGPYVDTFSAALVLAELKDKMPDPKGEKRLIAALDKTVGKMERNQKADGTFAGNNGWASILSQGLASKAFNRAAQNGVMVSGEVLKRDFDQTVATLDVKKGEFKSATEAAAAGAGKPGFAAGGLGGIPSDAGIPLYQQSGNTGRVADLIGTLRQKETKNKETLKNPGASKDDKDGAMRELKLLEDAEKAGDAATKGTVAKLEDKQFVAGFGNNGGEEFLSFMNISESLLIKGGTEWEKWDKAVTENLGKIQDKDGGWSGHHCITGRTFCTSSALLVLLADRAPVPVAAKVKEGK